MRETQVKKEQRIRERLSIGDGKNKKERSKEEVLLIKGVKHQIGRRRRSVSLQTGMG